MTNKKLNISPVELSKTDLSVLKVAVGILANNQIQIGILDADDRSGNVLLVDADSEAGEAAYQQLQNTRGQSLLVLTERSLNDQRNIVLRKPLRVQTLRDVLFDAHTQINAQTAGLSLGKKPEAEESAAQATPPVSQAPFDATRNLFFILLTAFREKQRLQVFYPPFSPMYADGSSGIIAASASRATLRKMVSNPSAQLKTLQLSEADFDILARGQVIMQFSHVLWSAALFGSQGRLVDGHALDEPVRLKAWPNFSRLDFESPHMALASLMASQALSLQQVREKTNFSLDVIIGFFNATLVTGLLDFQSFEPMQIKQPAAAKESKKAGIFAKIARRLNLDHGE